MCGGGGGGGGGGEREGKLSNCNKTRVKMDKNKQSKCIKTL